MIFNSPDLEIFGVYDRAVPNRERIVLRANQPTNLAEYFLILGVRGALGADMVFPMPDHSLWLGATLIEVPSWIFIFTGSGKTTVSQEMHTGEPIHSLYWNRPQVVLLHDDIVPALIHFDSVLIGNKPNKSLADISKRQDDNNSDALAQLIASLPKQAT